MPVSSPLVLIGATVLAGGILAQAFWSNRTNIGPLPPGPKSYPLIGQLLSIPQGDEYIAYKKMCEDLGSDIISLSCFGMTVVVLNNREDAINLLDKRSAIYSSRTLPVVLSDSSLLDWSKLGTLILYGDRWKLYRRLMSPWVTRNGANTFRHAQKREASLFAYRLLKRSKGPISSENLESELLLGLGAMFFRSIYGYEVKSLDDSFLVGVQSLFDYVEEACLPSRYWVNAIPALKHVPSWFPGAGWKRQVENWRKTKDSLVQDLYELATNHVNGQNDNPTIVSSLVEEALRLGLSQEQTDDYVQQIAITLYAGGSETTVNTLLMFFMAMLLYPEAQSKAQKELDSVLGDTRLPTFEDQSELGYVSRVVQEILRWQPTTPIAFPHTSLEKDIYKGYHIPAGTVVISNVWAMTQDPNTYADPETFEPDRFLDPSVPPSPLFGWGRRHCPGSHIAEEALFIFIASILCTFDIKAPKDEDGNDVLPTRKMLSDNAIVLHPEPFNFLLRPRSAKRENFIVDLAAEIRSE